MPKRRADLGELETLVMLAALRLKTESSVRRIREEVADRGGRPISRGAMYATVSRLEKKGFLKRDSQEAEQGRTQHHFEVTRQGLATLRTAQRYLTQMRAGLESILDSTT